MELIDYYRQVLKFHNEPVNQAPDAETELPEQV